MGSEGVDLIDAFLAALRYPPPLRYVIQRAVIAKYVRLLGIIHQDWKYGARLERCEEHTLDGMGLSFLISIFYFRSMDTLIHT